MQDLPDMQLLRRYAETRSEEAFALLITRHANLVYSVAFRKTGNRAAAEEIAQVVFILLAKKAGQLREGAVLAGWLYHTARLTSSAFLRAEYRRARREQEAAMKSPDNETESDVWPQIAPLLEDAMGKLNQKERSALVLRFFEKRTFGEIGAVTGATENGARKRVAHALEKLRKYFSRHGVNSTTVILEGAISANSIHAAPAGLVEAISIAAAAKGGAATTSTLTLIKATLKLMAWTKAKTIVVVGVVAILAAGTTTMIVRFQNRRVALPKPQPVAADETDFPKTSWHFAGYSSPESVFMSCMWAVNNDDTNTLLASVSPTERDRMNRENQIITAKDREIYAQMTSYRIVDKQILSEDKVVLAVETSRDPARKFLMERISGEWKFAGRAGK